MNTISMILISAATAAAPAEQGVLLDFTAKWCHPCQQMNAVVSRLKRQGHPIRKVDVDRRPDLVRKYGIKSIPAFLLVVKGREVSRIVGSTSERQLRELLAQIPKQSPPSSATSPQIAKSGRGPRKSKTPANLPIVEVVQTNAKTKRLFEFPFFGKKRNREVQLEPAPSRPPVIRAKHGRSDRRSGPQPVDKLVASTMRIRVKDDGGVRFGTGTVIDSRPGHSIVLTCGHVFRGLKKGAAIEVDSFRGDRIEQFVGRLIDYDTKADVGLVSIPTEEVLPVSRVAPQAAHLHAGDAVISIGCSGGQSPSRQQLQITALNRYDGPDNIECTGLPVQGRSGGGLFNTDGDVIGVCVGAEPTERRGLYAGLAAIQVLIDRAKLSHLYRSADQPEMPTHDPGIAVAEAQQEQSAHEAAEVATASLDNAPEINVRTIAEGTDRDADAVLEGFVSRKNQIAKALGNRAGDVEVVCIIRPLNNPEAASRVVIINRASPKFLSYLDGEINRKPKSTMTDNPKGAFPKGTSPKNTSSSRNVAKPAEVSKQTSGRPNRQRTARKRTSFNQETSLREPLRKARRYRRSAGSRLRKTVR